MRAMGRMFLPKLLSLRARIGLGRSRSSLKPPMKCRQRTEAPPARSRCACPTTQPHARSSSRLARLLPHRRISRGSLHPRAPKSFHLRSPHVWLRLRGRPWVVMPLQWWIARKRPRASFAKERSRSICSPTIHPLTIQKPLREHDRFCVRGHYYERTSLSLLEAAI